MDILDALRLQRRNTFAAAGSWIWFWERCNAVTEPDWLECEDEIRILQFLYRKGR